MKNKGKIFGIFLVFFLFTNYTFASDLVYKCGSGEFEYTTFAKPFGKRLKECVTQMKILPYDRDAKIEEKNFEIENGFNSRDKVANPTHSYNCHSLSFNNKNYRMMYPDNIFLTFHTGGKKANLKNAKKGDRGVIFKKKKDGRHYIDGQKYEINHSFIFLEDYKGLDTKIKSKYGSFGEYDHSLRDVLKPYNTDGGILTILPYDNGKNFTYRSMNYNLIENSNPYTRIDSLLGVKNYSYRSSINKTNKEIIDGIELGDLTYIMLVSSDKIQDKSDFLKAKNRYIKKLLENIKQEDIDYFIEKARQNNNLGYKSYLEFIEIMKYELKN